VAAVCHRWYFAFFSKRGDRTIEQFRLFVLSVDFQLLWGGID
jgi:hypothetical protein